MSKIGIKFIDGGRVFPCVCEIPDVQVGNKVVVETIRGLEIGIVCRPVEEESEEVKRVIRLVTPADEKTSAELKQKESGVIKITNELISKYSLEMKLVSVSFTLDGSKVIINYICDDRVDFRELVKDLASQLKLRIELRQIGVRDQTKILGGIGMCGKECCCKEYLNDFDKVSIKMAKTQGLSLNPTKISGLCGRLMCCLSYENDFYSEISVKMPKLNSRVKTKDGEGVVVYNNLLKQKVSVRVENDNDIRVCEYDLADITPIERGPEKKPIAQPKDIEKKPVEITETKEQKVESNNQPSASGNKNKKKFKKFNKNKNKPKENQ